MAWISMPFRLKNVAYLLRRNWESEKDKRFGREYISKTILIQREFIRAKEEEVNTHTALLI